MTAGMINQYFEKLKLDLKIKVHHTSNSINNKAQIAFITINALVFSQPSFDIALKKR